MGCQAWPVICNSSGNQNRWHRTSRLDGPEELFHLLHVSYFGGELTGTLALHCVAASSAQEPQRCVQSQAGRKGGRLAGGSNWASLANLTDGGIMLQFMQASSMRASNRWSKPRQAPQWSWKSSASAGGQAAATILLHGHLEARNPQGARPKSMEPPGTEVPTEYTQRNTRPDWERGRASFFFFFFPETPLFHANVEGQLQREQKTVSFLNKRRLQ